MSTDRQVAPKVGVAAVCLGLMMPLVDAGLLLGWSWGGVLATPFLVAYLVLCWPRIMLSARLLLIACLLLCLFVLTLPGGVDLLKEALARTTFLPAFVAALGLLRAAADASGTVARAGRVLVSQPPSRRYAALTVGGQIFAILFNIGGLALLLDMTRRANTLEAANGDPRVVALRERRMTLAILRGFSTIPFWSPLGLALNLLLASMPDVAWMDVAPAGFAASIAFMGLGFLFDRLENPPSGRPPARLEGAGGGWAVVAMVGHIVLLCGLALGAELLLEIPFQAVLINLVPLYAMGWLIASGLRRGGGEILSSSARLLRDKGIARWPAYANEISIFVASGLMGVILAELAPREALQALIWGLDLPAGVFAAGLAAVVFVLGFIGIHPMITAAILAGTFSAITVPGLSHADVVLALAGGWVCIIGLGPMMSSLVLTAAIVGRQSSVLGLKWNGRFSALALTLWLVALLFIRI